MLFLTNFFCHMTMQILPQQYLFVFCTCSCKPRPSVKTTLKEERAGLAACFGHTVSQKLHSLHCSKGVPASIPL